MKIDFGRLYYAVCGHFENVSCCRAASLGKKDSGILLAMLDGHRMRAESALGDFCHAAGLDWEKLRGLRREG